MAPWSILLIFRLWSCLGILSVITNTKQHKAYVMILPINSKRPPFLLSTKCGIDGSVCNHDDVIKWKHFTRYWPFVRGIHRSPVNSPHKGHWRGALMFSLICAWINGSVNNREAGDLRRIRPQLWRHSNGLRLSGAPLVTGNDWYYYPMELNTSMIFCGIWLLQSPNFNGC